MQAKIDTISNLFSDLKLEDLNSNLKSIFASLSEPKNAGILAASVASTYIVYKIVDYNFSQKRFPDFPRVSWFSDHRPILNDSKSGGEFIRRINKYGYPVGYIRFFFHKILVICDLRYTKELFLTHGVPSSGRVTGHRIHMDDIYHQGVLFSSGEPWKNSRRIFLNFLRNWGRENQVELILQETKFLLEALETHSEAFDPSSVLQAAVCNVISTLIFGARIEYSDPMIHVAFESIFILNTQNERLPDIAWILLAKFPIFPWVRKRIVAIKRTKDYIRNKIESIIETGIRDPPETLAEAYALEIVERGHKLDMDALLAMMHELFFAGTETTSTTLQWAFAILALHPEVQEKMFEEIDSVVGNGKLTSKHLKDLTYCTAAQHEIQRVGCIVQDTVPHKMLESVTLESGETIPKGTTVLGSIAWIMSDEKHWKNPKKFDPENFLNEKGQFEKNDAFIPYGVGPRVCLGQHLADLELKIFMFEIVRKFKISSPDNIDLENRIQKVTSAPYPYNYRFEVR